MKAILRPRLPFSSSLLTKTLGQAGEIEPETEGILTEYDVDFSEFSDEVLACLPHNLPWTIPPEEMSMRRDLRSDSAHCTCSCPSMFLFQCGSCTGLISLVLTQAIS